MNHPEKTTLLDPNTRNLIQTGETISNDLVSKWKEYTDQERARLSLIFGRNEPCIRCYLLKQSIEDDIPTTRYLGEFPTLRAAKGEDSESLLSFLKPHIVWEENWVEGSEYGFTIADTTSKKLPQRVPTNIRCMPRHIMKWPFHKTWFGRSGGEILWVSEADFIEYEEPENLYATLDWGRDSYTFSVVATSIRMALQQVLRYIDCHPGTFGSEGYSIEGIQDSVTFHSKM